MQSMVLKHGTLYTQYEVIIDGWVLIEHGAIAAIGSGQYPASEAVFDMSGLAILPGFIDLHVHGALGLDTMGATPQALYDMARYYAQQGVTGFLAATITASPAATHAALENIASCMGPIPAGATLLGAYLEGPCISAQAKGAHYEPFIRRADRAECASWFATGAVKQVTIAPEFPENILFLKECVARDIVTSIGHTTADYDTVNHAVAIGAIQATHTFNGMGGIHHRAPGTAGAVLTNDSIVAELIADMVHVHPAILNLAVRAKGADKIVLVTDAESGAGLEPGIYTINERVLHVTSNGVYLPNGTLAGSTITMQKALANIMQATDISLEHAWPMSSYNAARQLGLAHRTGLLAVNYDADIVILNPQDYAVVMTIAQGKIVYDSRAVQLDQSERMYGKIQTEHISAAN